MFAVSVYFETLICKSKFNDIFCTYIYSAEIYVDAQVDLDVAIKMSEKGS